MVPNLRDTSVGTHLDILAQENPDIKDLLAVYPEEVGEKLLANKKKLAKIIKVFSNVTGYADANSVIMTCNPLECPYRTICVLRQNDMAPDGYSCPVEKKMVLEVESSVVDTLEIDRSDPIEMELLWDLIDTKIIDMRASATLKSGKVTQEVKQQVAKVIQTKEELHPALEMKLDLKRIKHSIMDQFVATRRSKKKYGMQSDRGTLEALLLNAAKSRQLEDKADVS